MGMDNPKSAPARKYTLKTAHPSPQTTAPKGWESVEPTPTEAEATAWAKVQRLAKMGGM